ncbi:MAG: PRC-barrel domain-containing protein [Alphaproteobacteria bacterium]|nr:PRC-barrel domain-containing protein [Alphaproteobacteria bacterium]
MFRIRRPGLERLRLWSAGAGLLILAALGLSAALAQSPSAGRAEEPSASAKLNGATLDYFPREHLFRILGKDVLSAKGENMGRIVDVLFDAKGQPRAAVIDFGGFLGVGTRKIAITWSVLHFDLGEKKNVIALDVGRDQLKAAPAYNESDKPIPVVSQPQSPAPAEATSEPAR